MVKVDIIFTVLNDLDRLKWSLEKLSQSYQKDLFNIIVVDGKSKDGTVAFLKEKTDQIDQWISEPDLGIYDGMNKGIRLAKNEWVIFINAGDVLVSVNSLSEILSKNEKADVIYGGSIVKYPDFHILKKAGPMIDIWKGMMFSHQSVFVKTKLLKENEFNLDYNLGADYDQIFSLYKQNCRFKYVPAPISIIQSGGVSDQNLIKSWSEHYKILRTHENISLKMQFYQIKLFLFLLLIKISRTIVPRVLYLWAIKMIHRKRLVTSSEY